MIESLEALGLAALGISPGGVLNLDHSGTERRQVIGGERSGHDVREIQHGHAMESRGI